MKTIKYGENDKFSIMPLKQLSGLIDPINRPRTLELWVITHENDQIWRNRQVFSRASQTSIGSYGPYKSRWNPKMVDNSS